MLIANMTVEEIIAVMEAVKTKVEAVALTDLTYADIKTHAVVTAHAPDNFYHFVMVGNEKSTTPGDELYGVCLLYTSILFLLFQKKKRFLPRVIYWNRKSILIHFIFINFR